MNIQKKLEANLKVHLKMVCPNHWFGDVYQYAVIPPGKLFRPQLVVAIENDFQNSATFSNDPHSFLASAIEIHHTYTLIHDDLPCMDDDDLRRGRPSTHKKFGQWQALLAGDGLLNGSYQLLAHIPSQRLIRYFSWCVGSRGLIQGQILDLSEEMNQDFSTLLETHKLKTARLIQTSIVGSYLLTENANFKTAKELHRLGLHLGWAFQFLDDLSEFSENEVPPHELKINPWLTFPDQSLKTLTNSLEFIQTTIATLNLTTTAIVLSAYFTKMDGLITENISKHYSGNISKIKKLLDTLKD